jgi:hypothetical protein
MKVLNKLLQTFCYPTPGQPHLLAQKLSFLPSAGEGSKIELALGLTGLGLSNHLVMQSFT